MHLFTTVYFILLFIYYDLLVNDVFYMLICQYIASCAAQEHYLPHVSHKKIVFMLNSVP